MGCSSSRSQVVQHKGTRPPSTSKRLLDEYAVGEQLGEGAFGVVYTCTNRITGEEVAVKMVDKVETPIDAINKEIEMLRTLNHQNIVKFHNVYYERCFVCIVMDKYSGGDIVEGMQRHLSERGKLTGSKIVHVIAQMAAGLLYLHSRSVAHRDVKGDNYLMDRVRITDPKCRVALSDFGTACPLRRNERLADEVGTRVFWAPEFYDRNYGLKVDVWALGVLMFGLLDGHFPFKGETDVRKKEPRLPSTVEHDCKDLIKAALRKDEEKRLSAEGLAAHRWISPEGIGPNEVPVDAVGRITSGDSKGSHEDNKGGRCIRTELVHDGVHSRRQELLGRILEVHNRGAAKAHNGVQGLHYYSKSFAVADRSAAGVVYAFEWWPAERLEASKVMAFQAGTEQPEVGGNLDRSPVVVGQILRDHNIDTSSFGCGDAKSLDQLAAEVESGNARLLLDATEHKKLVRVVDVVVLRLYSEQDQRRARLLVETGERYPDGRRRELCRLPASKKRPHENAPEAARRALEELLGMGSCAVHLDHRGVSDVFEEEFESPSFPGVRTVYRKEVVRGWVQAQAAAWGLPACAPWTAEDPRHNVKYLEWWTERQAVEARIKLGAEGSEEVSGLVEAPIGLQEERLAEQLEACGVDLSSFGQGVSKSLKEFSAELMQGEASLLTTKAGDAIRLVDVVLLMLKDPRNGEHLVQTEQTTPAGNRSAFERLPGARKRPDENQFLTARRVLQKQLRIDENEVQINANGVKCFEEERFTSDFPGIQTIYRTRLIPITLLNNRTADGKGDDAATELHRP